MIFNNKNVSKAYFKNRIISYNNGYERIYPLITPIVTILPNNEIWYTSSNGQIVTPYRTNALPTIVSNTYSDGKGVITFETDVTTIGEFAFGYRTELTSITLPDSVTNIGTRPFYYCDGLISVNIPKNVTSIGTAAFEGCSSLPYVIIPNSVTSIGDYCFRNNTSLMSVYISDIKAWCAIDFGATWTPLYYAHNLYLNNVLITDLIIPDGTPSIGAYAFRYWTGVKSLSIPNSVTSIGTYAFSDCSNLTSISYNGTKSQWNTITMGTFWIYGSPVTVVHCTDGDAPLIN